MDVVLDSAVFGGIPCSSLLLATAGNSCWTGATTVDGGELVILDRRVCASGFDLESRSDSANGGRFHN